MDAKHEMVAVHLKHAPLVLRVDEMIEGPLGIMTARAVAEIPLSRGINQVDALLWRRWLEQNKDGPLVREGLIIEESKDHGASPEPEPAA